MTNADLDEMDLKTGIKWMLDNPDADLKDQYGNRYFWNEKHFRTPGFYWIPLNAQHIDTCKTFDKDLIFTISPED